MAVRFLEELKSPVNRGSFVCLCRVILIDFVSSAAVPFISSKRASGSSFLVGSRRHRS